MNRQFFRVRQGVTLIELLVSISLASIVFMVTGSLMATFVNQNTRSERQEQFEQAKNDLAVELSNAIKWAGEVSVSGNTLTVDGDVYSVAEGNFLKNGQNLIPETVAIRSFEVVNMSADPELFGADIRVEFEYRNYPLAADAMHLVVAQRRTEITVQ